MAAHQVCTRTTIILILRPEINVSFFINLQLFYNEKEFTKIALLSGVSRRALVHTIRCMRVCVYLCTEQRLSHAGLFKLIKKCLIDYAEMGCCVAGKALTRCSVGVCVFHSYAITSQQDQKLIC